MNVIFIIAGIVVVLTLLAIFISLSFYTVVEPNKAHVVVAFSGGRKIYHPSLNNQKSAYFYIPMFMRRIIVSLENVKHEINNIELRDSKFAPFRCDITCWFKIANPDLAAEKLDVNEDGGIMDSIRETLNAQVQGVVRAAAMKQEIVELMQDRTTFGKSVFMEVNGDLDEWGVQLVKLEIIDFSDSENSNVIQDYESRREAEISSLTRQSVAKNDQEAKVKEAEALKTSETARIEAEQLIQMRDLERKENIGVRDQAARLKVATQTDLANERQVLADKTKVVGEAKYQAEASVILADGKKNSAIKESEGLKEAKINTAKGEAESIDMTGTAQANVIEKQAEAQKKFQDASKEIELAKISADIQKTKYTSVAEALKQANIQIISRDMSFMGFGAEQGAGIGKFLDNIESSSGVDVKSIIKNFLPKKEKVTDKEKV